MSVKGSFYDLVLADVVEPEDVDDFIGDWHDGEGEGQELWEYLGISEDEYELLVDNAEEFFELMRWDRETANEHS